MKAIISIFFVLSLTCVNAQKIDSMVSKHPDAFTLVDKAASYPGGIEELYDYLSSELNYPKAALSEGVEGRVFVQLIVEENGELTNLQVVKGIGAGCDEEAMRVIEKSSPWNPGQIDGKPVRQILIQNILFEIADSK